MIGLCHGKIIRSSHIGYTMFLTKNLVEASGNSDHAQIKKRTSTTLNSLSTGKVSRSTRIYQMTQQ